MSETPDVQFANYVRWHYGRDASEYRPSKVKGYWQRITPCGGLAGGCREPIHTTAFNEGPLHHTIYYRDEGRDASGRFVTPFATWRKHRERAAAGGT